MPSSYKLKNLITSKIILIFAPMIHVKDILDRLKFLSLTPMQEELLGIHQEHKNIMLLSPTGSGKTLAYLLASFQKIQDTESKETEVVIIAPTRELVIQIEDVIKKCGTGLKTAKMYGGRKLSTESDILSGNVKFIIATPGRLADHLRRGNISADSIHHLVIDEFDKCVEMGFTDELLEIFSYIENIDTRIITSATSNTPVPSFVGFNNSHLIDFSQDNTPLNEGNITTKIIEIKRDSLTTLAELLASLDNLPTLVFCNYRESCERVYDHLRREEDIICDYYHGGQEQYIRERALLKLRIGAVNVLVATDLAARGLDISSLGYVIHFEQPLSIESFTHRSGRTGRMGEEGENYIITRSVDALPEYIAESGEVVTIGKRKNIDRTPAMAMLCIGAGRKQKIGKGDIVGFLTQVCKLPVSKIGNIQIVDNESYVAIERKEIESVVDIARGSKLKKNKPLFRHIR